EIISPTLGNELLNFSRNIRNNIVHPKGILGFSMLGMKARYKTKDSISWESPTGKPISLFTAKEASELGIELYLQTMKDILC
ncbi:MAG: hypothetical protein ACXADX_05655, partial [Candidatus Hodarchaeales archaeon]